LNLVTVSVQSHAELQKAVAAEMHYTLLCIACCDKLISCFHLPRKREVGGGGNSCGEKGAEHLNFFPLFAYSLHDPRRTNLRH